MRPFFALRISAISGTQSDRVAKSSAGERLLRRATKASLAAVVSTSRLQMSSVE